MSGFDVNPDELTQFAGKLEGHQGRAAEIAGLVAKADVSDRSWGVVGLFNKDKYTQMLGDLNDLFADMQAGLQSGANKFRGTAQGFQVEIDRK